jgi:hypothetical protein
VFAIIIAHVVSVVVVILVLLTTVDKASAAVRLGFKAKVVEGTRLVAM